MTLLCTTTLTVPMRDMLWRVAQHKYGWCYVNPHRGQPQVAAALVRRGLVKLHCPKRDPHIVATEAGKAEIARRWPVSPFILDTYEHQPEGWTPKAGVAS